MRNRATIVVAALAAGTFGLISAASAATSSSSSAGDATNARLVRSAEGGNGVATYNYVRTDAPRRAARPFALAGQSDRPTHYKAVGNVGGNGRTINLVPQWDGPVR